jgi:pilus assembly protein FimV
MALGRVTVLSALGEPLRADIDIPQITPEEVASLKARIAGPDAFRAAGMEVSQSLQNVTMTLQRRPDGHYFLRLTTSQPINDPFVDLILEASWSSGRIVRDYTMLFDPPNLRAPSAPLSAQVSPVPAPAPVQATPAAPSNVARAPAPPAARAPVARAPAPRAAAPSPAAPRPAPAPAARATPAPAAAPTPSGDGKRVTVKEGDTATRIANANKPSNISLDQMLIALLRMNPDAFSGNNVNRLRAGAVLEMPSAAQASAVDAKESREVLVAQTRDFNEYRRRLAEGLPVRDMRSGDRVVAGKVTTQVEDRKPAATNADKLSLSKGAVQGSRAADQVAQQRSAQDTAARVAELNKNISELNKLGKSAASGPGTGAAANGAKPGVPVAVGAPGAAAAKAASTPAAAPATAGSARPTATPATTAPAAAPSAAASPMANVASGASGAASAPTTSAVMPGSAAPAMASASAAPAPAPVAAAAPAKPAAAPPPAAEPSFVDQLLDNPLIPAAGVGLLAMLLGLGFYKMRQRRKATQVDSSFLESRLQPDSFFGASGGQRIDTAEGSSAATGSSMVYSPSQLDAAGDVDPVAEADVYLAYGRDLQAEEILKEALRTNPSRVAIHAKLLEIYAKRRDAKAFEVIATEAYKLTNGAGPEWEHICELGRELDPSNAMYRPGGQPDEGAMKAAAAAVASPTSYGATQVTQAVPQPEAAPNVDLDLDLDFSLGDGDETVARAPAASAAIAAAAAAAAAAATPAASERTQAVEPTVAMTAPPALDLDFGAPGSASQAPAPAAASSEPPARLDAPDLTLDENALSFDATPPAAPAPAPVAATGAAPVAAAPAPAAAAAGGDGMIEFDLGNLSLDLPGKEEDSGHSTSGSTAGLEPEAAGGGDPLATKLALAEEFNAIGDPDGARSLAEEVLAEASGELKNRAQKLLAEIG